MKKLIVLACLATTISMTAVTAMADSIKGRFGVTGKIGVLIPAEISSDSYNKRPDPGLIGGGGVIYGFDDHFAAEAEVTRTSFSSGIGDFGVTDFSLGGQYRIRLSNRPLVPFIGIGMDILFSDFNPHNWTAHDVDTKVGGHVKAGVDYFLLRQLALTAEAKLVVAPTAGISDNNGNHRGTFDPSSLSGTIGIRYFFN
jgi:outer membrane protein